MYSIRPCKWKTGKIGFMKALLRKIPVLGKITSRLYWRIRSRPGPPEIFSGSGAYWERRYRNGGDSGVGSYGKFAMFKAEVINTFVADRLVGSVIEFGSGDGNQLKLAEYPRYLGFDVSDAAISACRQQFSADPSKEFRPMREFKGERADLALSLDVIYHLVEDTSYEDYMATLFNSADRYVIIYSSNSDDNRTHIGAHIRHRKFTDWIAGNARNWTMIGHIPNKYPYHGDHREGSFADFYFYEKSGPPISRE